MSLTCSFRCLAGQVKDRLTGTPRRRSSSNHECHCPWEEDKTPIGEVRTHARAISCQRPSSPTRVRVYPETSRSTCVLSSDTGLHNNAGNMYPQITREQHAIENTNPTFQPNTSGTSPVLDPNRPQRQLVQSKRRATQTLTLVGPSTQNDQSPQTQRPVGNVHNNPVCSHSGSQTPCSVRSIASTSQQEARSVPTTWVQQSVECGQHGNRHISQQMFLSQHQMNDSSMSSNSRNNSLSDAHQRDSEKRSPTANRGETRAQQTPNLSIPEVEHRSGSLGSSVPCFYPMQMHKMQRYFGPSWSDLPLQAEQEAMQRLHVSHTGLNELSLQHTSVRNHDMNRSQELNAMHFQSQVNSLHHLMTNSSYPYQGTSSHSSLSPYGSRQHETTTPLLVQSAAKTSGHSRNKPARIPNALPSNEDVAPVLPARSTSLLARNWNYQPDQLQYTTTPGSEAGRTKRQPSKSMSYSTRHLINTHNQASNSQTHTNDGHRSAHLRSRSELVKSSRRCYVNATESIPTVSEVCIPLTTASTNQEIVSPERMGETTLETSAPTSTQEQCRSDFVSRSSVSSVNSETEPRDLSPHSKSLKHPAITVSVPNSPSCGVLEQFMPTNHASRLLGRMSDKLRDGRLADVILLADRPSKRSLGEHNTGSTVESGSEGSKPPIRIPAHRVILAAASDYFAAMFGNELKEATEMEIRIHDVDPAALQTLINYIYTGFLDLREDTVEDILEAACFLQMPEASQACERFLIKRLHGSNCLGMARLGEQHGCRLLHRKATKYALEHFTEVVQQPDFLTLTVAELTELLSSDHLKVPNEATVFAACLRWMRNVQRIYHNSSRSSSVLPTLLNLVRLQQVPARLLVDVLEKEPLFQQDLEATRMLISALRFQLSPEPKPAWMMDCKQSGNAALCSKVRLGLQDGNPSEYVESKHEPSSPCTQQRSSLSHAVSETSLPSRQSPRPSTIGQLWALGGKTMTTTRALQEILEYDPYTNQWRVVGQLPGQRQQCGCIVLNDGRLLVVGGRDELKTLSTVECIHTEELSSQTESQLTRSVTLNREDRSGGWLAGESATLSRHSRQISTDSDSNSMTRSVIDTRTDANGTPDQGTLHPHQQQQQNSESNNEHTSGWHIVSAMATHRHGLGVAVLEGVVYAVGGHDGWSYLNTVERWNGRAKSWSPVTPMAVQRSTVGVAALDGLLYAVGGRDGSACLRTVERFNPHTQHWCFIAPMLHRRGGVGVAAASGRLYAVGGHNAPPSQPHAVRTASVEMYDPQTDMWSEVASLSSPRDSIAVATLGTKLYAIGGHDGLVYTDRVQVFDPETNEWSEAAPLPSGRAGVAVASSQPFGALFNQNSRLPYYKADPLA